MNIFLLLLIFGNLAIGLGPLFIKFLPNLSPFTIGFIRFVIAAIIEFAVIVYLWIRLYVKYRKSQEAKKTNFIKIIGRSLKNYYLGKNSLFYKGTPQIIYLSILGFLIVGIVVPFYYLSFQIVGVVFSTILVNAIPILYIAVFNYVKRIEDMDAFKVIYLILLSAGVITIAMSYENTGNANFSILGIFVLMLTIFAFITYTLHIGQDSLRRANIFKFETLSSTFQQNNRSEMRTLRSFYKLFGIHFMGNILFFLLMVFLSIGDTKSIIGEEAQKFISTDLADSFSLLLNPFLISLAIVCTLIPYIIQVISSSNWPKHELGFDSWNSVLTVLQPLVGVYIGLLIWHESISLDYILFTSIFLIISIVIRYFHESANFRLVLFRIQIRNSQIQPFIQFIRNFREIEEVFITFGKIGVIFHATFRSLPRLFLVIQNIQAFEGVIDVKYYPEEEIKESVED